MKHPTLTIDGETKTMDEWKAIHSELCKVFGQSVAIVSNPPPVMIMERVQEQPQWRPPPFFPNPGPVCGDAFGIGLHSTCLRS